MANPRAEESFRLDQTFLLALLNHPRTLRELPRQLLPVDPAKSVGSLGFAIGEAVAGARARGIHPIEAVCAVTHDTAYGRGIPVFEGKVVDVDRRTSGGFVVGQTVLQGLKAWQGSQLVVQFQNENHLAVLDGEVVVSVPDLICLLDSEVATAVTSERLRYGQRVTAVGIPTPEIMRSDAALRVWGPRAFGHDIPFVPLERRFANYYDKHGVSHDKKKYLQASSRS